MSGELGTSLGDTHSDTDPARGLKSLIREEHAILARARSKRGKTDRDAKIAPGDDPDQLDVSPLGVANEPWVSFTARDYFGVALSGGGIRSATFNLGLLQALADKKVLDQVDYLSTVSGGGYIGAFWTAWRYRHSQEYGEFPLSAEKDSDHQDHACRDERESARIRHLRQFSRFLMPRLGIAHSESWAGVVAILGGIIPSLATALALLGAVLYLWFGTSVCLFAGNYAESAWLEPFSFGAATLGLPVNDWFASSSFMATVLGEHVYDWFAPVAFGATTLGLHAYMEWRWRKANTGGEEKGSRGYNYLCSFTVIASALALGCLRAKWLTDGVQTNQLVQVWIPSAKSISCWDLPAKAQLFRQQMAIFGAPTAWGGAALGLLISRTFLVRCLNHANCVRWSSLFDRTIARLLAPAVVWFGLGVTWLLAARVREFDGEATLASSGVGLAALFVWFRNWLAKPVVRTQGSELVTKLLPWLRPLLPQILANAAFVCFLLVVAILIQMYGLEGSGTVIGIVSSAGTLLLTLCFFNPARVGMHDFYRARIARCFLGAARPLTPRPTQLATTEQSDDDMTFRQIGEGPRPMPIHLVCCAANNLSGDPLGSLYRGARSAVVSPVGISIADAWAPTRGLHDLRLSSAITASAAAFNSQMGSVSMALGPAVAFLMSALNLRLGLWVPHPLSNSKLRSKLFPGWPFFLEMLGLTSCGPATSATKLGLLESRVHLSDGGHFENLALYELVRRHCRHIIVSDCGADPDYAFADLANAVRRIREDFGVEVELDTTPLRPGVSGRAGQHAVVGTIHYNGLTGHDKGRVIYFKPVLTGDEPPDILQYQVRRPSFPHETTVDQFYDEAQWESYRRLGEHAVHAALRQINPSSNANRVDALFLEASQRWHPRLERHKEIFLELSQRYVSLEAAIGREAPAVLRAEFLPEVAEALGVARPDDLSVEQQNLDHRPERSAATEDETTKIIYFLIPVLQLMEDVWVGLELETYWSHPLNEGWMNYFQRWASAPSLRRWWPVLRPLYSVGFRDFVRDRFELRLNEEARNESGRGAQLILKPVSTPVADISGSANPLDGLALQQWLRRYPAPPSVGKHALVYEMQLEGSNADGLSSIEVGFLLYSQTASLIEWHESDLFVPPSLNGAGITARFLDAVIMFFVNLKPQVSQIQVVIGEGEGEAATETPSTKDCMPLENQPGVAKGKPTKKPTTATGRDLASRTDHVRLISFYKSRGFTYLGANARHVLKLELATLR